MANKKDGSCTLRILEKTNIIYLLWFLSNNILWSIVLVSNIDHIGSSGNCRSLERPTRCGFANRSSSKWPIANRLHGVSWWDLYWSVTLGQAKFFEDFVNQLQTWHFFLLQYFMKFKYLYITYTFLLDVGKFSNASTCWIFWFISDLVCPMFIPPLWAYGVWLTFCLYHNITYFTIFNLNSLLFFFVEYVADIRIHNFFFQLYTFLWNSQSHYARKAIVSFK